MLTESLTWGDYDGDGNDQVLASRTRSAVRVIVPQTTFAPCTAPRFRWLQVTLRDTHRDSG